MRNDNHTPVKTILDEGALRAAQAARQKALKECRDPFCMDDHDRAFIEAYELNKPASQEALNAEEGESVAWQCEFKFMGDWYPRLVSSKPEGRRFRNITPLFAHPKPSPATGLVEALEEAHEHLGGVSSPVMNGDNLAVTLCTLFDDPDAEDTDDTGWSEAARFGCKQVLDAIHAHYVAALNAPTPSQEEGQSDVTTPTRPNWPEVYRDCAGPLEGEKAGDLVSVTRESARLAEGALRFYRSEIAAYHTHMAAEAEISEVLK